MFRQRPRGRTVHRADSRKSAHDAHFDPTNGVGIENRGFFNGLLASKIGARRHIWQFFLSVMGWNPDVRAHRPLHSPQLQFPVKVRL
jgi:hypothetical protein